MKHRGRGLAAIEYPTGMNQGGDPSQAWVKIKPDGRVDVFAGTVDLGQGSKTVHTQIVADTLGVPYESVNMDVSNTDSSPLCTGTFASRGTFIGGLAVLKAAKKAKEKMLEIAGQAMEIAPADLEVEDGVIFVKGSPDKKMTVGEVSAAATWGFGELITGTGVHLKAYSMPDPDTGECDPDHAISYAACVVDVEVDDETGVVTVLRMVQAYDVGHAINPTLVEGQIEGGAMMGLGLGLLEQSYPHYPSVEGRGGEFGAYLMPGLQNFPEITSVIVENPSADGPFGAKAIGEMANNAQGPAICSAIHDAVGVWVPQQPATPERVLRALQAKTAGTDEPRRDGKTVDLRRGHQRHDAGRRVVAASATSSESEMSDSPFRSWNDVPTTEFHPGVHLRAIGGEQVCLCKATYEPGKQVPLHTHEHTEQVMVILDGEVTMTIAGETKTLKEGDVVVVNRGIEHSLISETGVTFLEALAPVPLDHIPDKQRDLVLGPDGGATHVDK